MSKKLTTSEFQERLTSIYGNQFILKSEYVNNCTKVELFCNECGNTIYKVPRKLTGSIKEGCYICHKKNHYKDKNYLQNEIDLLYPNQFLIIEEYVNSRTPIKIKRIQCGHEYSISPDNLLRGKGCPKCSMRQSSYMDIVEKYLNDHNIKYEKEKRFDDCRNIKTLPFDYYLLDFNCCIEVDGQFHYSNNSVYKDDAKNSYESIKKRDNIKTKYCNDRGIKLIRLPYYEFENFSNILDKELLVNTEVTKII